MRTNLFQLFNRVISSTLFRTSGIYTTSSFINAAIPLLLLPILTRKLSPSDYGIVAMFQLVVNVIYPFIGMNLEGSIARRYYDKNCSDFPSYVGSSLVLVVGSFLIVSLLFLSFINFIGNITQIPEFWVIYVLLVALSQFLTTTVLVLFQIKVQPFKYGILQISQSVINVSLTILFVVILHKTWNGRLEALIISGVIFAIVSLYILFKSKQIRFNIKKEDIKNALNFGVPLIPHAIGGILFTAIDRFFLTNLKGLEQTGNYSVAYQIGMVVNLITVAFNNAYVPWLFENLNKNDISVNKKIVKFTYLYFILLLLGATLLLLFFPLIISIFVGGKFNNINTYSTFIVYGFVFQGMYFMVTNYITYAQKTYILSAITISVAILKFPITYFSIIIFGAIGASLSYCITFFIYFIATWILSTKVHKMPWTTAFI